MRFAKYIFLFTLISTLVSCRQETKPSLERGRDIFMSFGCIRCHHVAGKGGLLGPDLTYVGFRKKPEWLDLWLRNPHAWKNNTLMPNFNLRDNLRESLVLYLSSLKGEAYREGKKPWDNEELASDPVKRGSVIFEKAGCVGCHAKGGVGGYPNNNTVGGKIPTLTFVADGYSKEELKERIRKGKVPDKANASEPAPLIQMPPWGQVLTEDEMDSLVAYLYSLRPAKPAGEEW